MGTVRYCTGETTGDVMPVLSVVPLALVAVHRDVVQGVRPTQPEFHHRRNLMKIVELNIFH
jgi:hypothetical protein